MTRTAAPAVSRQAKLTLGFMFAAATLNYMDRALLGVLQEAIKVDLSLTDTQLGLAGGPAFAILYTLMTIPLSRVADRSHRTRLMVGILSFWSVMTALCGAVANFGQLLLARFAVSIGESGGTPIAQSLLSDRFPPARRAGALSIYTSGGFMGYLVAGFLGGAIEHSLGWRATFAICGGIGIAVALLLALSVKEPPRLNVPAARAVPLREALGAFKTRKSFIHLCVGMGLASFSINAIVSFFTSFLHRCYDLPLNKAALVAGLLTGGVGMVSSFGTGFAIDRLREREPRIGFLLAMAGCLIGCLSYLIIFQMTSLALALPVMIFAAFFGQIYLAAGWSSAQDVAPPHLRATAAGLVTLAIGLFGIGTAPPLLGLVSDAVAASHLAGTGLSPRACAALASDPRCAVALAAGVRAGLSVISLPLLWAAFHFWRGSHSVVADLSTL